MVTLTVYLPAFFTVYAVFTLVQPVKVLVAAFRPEIATVIFLPLALVTATVITRFETETVITGVGTFQVIVAVAVPVPPLPSL